MAPMTTVMTTAMAIDIKAISRRPLDGYQAVCPAVLHGRSAPPGFQSAVTMEIASRRAGSIFGSLKATLIS